MPTRAQLDAAAQRAGFRDAAERRAYRAAARDRLEPGTPRDRVDVKAAALRRADRSAQVLGFPDAATRRTYARKASAAGFTGRTRAATADRLRAARQMYQGDRRRAARRGEPVAPGMSKQDAGRLGQALRGLSARQKQIARVLIADAMNKPPGRARVRALVRAALQAGLSPRALIGALY
jgi:hypothetical protein